MKITAVDVFPIRGTVEHPFEGSIATSNYTHRYSLLVRVRTDDGIEGWGETYGPLKTLAVGIKEVLEPILLGKDPLVTGTLYARMDRAARAVRPGLSRALSAVDMALWDIKGHTFQQSIARLMGREGGGRYPAVATAIFYAGEDHAVAPRLAEAERLLQDGYFGIKIKVGGLSPAEDVDHVRAIRGAVGDDIVLCVDANSAYRVQTAVGVAKKLEDLGVYWFEEPVPVEDTEAYAEIARSSAMYLAGGQSLQSAAAFLPLLEARALHLVQANLAAVGGFTELQRLLAIVDSYNALYSPPAWGTGLLLAAALQARAASASLLKSPSPDLDWVECDVTDNPLREGVLETPIKVKDGYLEMPTGPGLGVKVNEAAVRSFAF
ncbi:MAG: mandelate racemase/muconate lactonizing enzyme family protein [Chloroflexi bacterium]|nr:mandelate racemase/muconate lactonizing enzyme family protein [Chloroflexota bacterium]